MLLDKKLAFKILAEATIKELEKPISLAPRKVKTFHVIRDRLLPLLSQVIYRKDYDLGSFAIVLNNFSACDASAFV